MKQRTVVQVETASADVVSSIATFGTYLIANHTTQGDAATKPMTKVKTAVRLLCKTKNAQPTISVEVGTKTKNAAETA